jgi:hypothetical protein
MLPFEAQRNVGTTTDATSRTSDANLTKFFLIFSECEDFDVAGTRRRWLSNHPVCGALAMVDLFLACSGHARSQTIRRRGKEREAKANRPLEGSGTVPLPAGEAACGRHKSRHNIRNGGRRCSQLTQYQRIGTLRIGKTSPPLTLHLRVSSRETDGSAANPATHAWAPGESEDSNAPGSCSTSGAFCSNLKRGAGKSLLESSGSS